MKLLVGSLNPVKIEAARKAFSHYFENFEVKGVKVESGVSDMPMSEDETIQGAINRANNLKKEEADYYVGLEGGCHERKEGMAFFGWAAVLDKKGNLGLGSSGQAILPEGMAERIRNKEELGPIVEKLTGLKNVGQKEGAIGLATKNVVTRTEFLERAIVFALVKFINKEYNDLK